MSRDKTGEGSNIGNKWVRLLLIYAHVERPTTVEKEDAVDK